MLVPVTCSRRIIGCINQCLFLFAANCGNMEKCDYMIIYEYWVIWGYVCRHFGQISPVIPVEWFFFSNRLGVMSWSKLLMPDFLLCCCLSQWFGYGNLVSTANWLWNTTEYVSNGGCPTWASLAKEYPKFRRVVDHPIPSWTEIVVASLTYRHPQVRLQRLNFPQEIHCFFSASGAFNAALAKDARAAWTAKARDDDGHLLLGRKSDGDHQALDLDAQKQVGVMQSKHKDFSW